MNMLEFDIIQWVEENVGEDTPLDEQLLKEQQEEEILNEINASIAEQVCTELEDQENTRRNSRRQMPTWLKVAGTAMAVFVLICLFLVSTPVGRNFILRAALNILNPVK